MNENQSPGFINEEEEEEETILLDLLQTLAENARLLIFGPLLAGLLAFGVSFTFKPSYSAQTSIMAPQPQGGAAAAALAQLGGLAGMAGAAAGMKSPTEMYIGLLKSRTIADRLVDRFNMMTIPDVETREDARDILARVSRITPRKDGFITIEAISSVPQLSAALANAYVEELAVLTGRLAVTEAQKRRQFLEKELFKAKTSLVKAEIALGGIGIDESTLKFNPAVMGQGLATLKAQIMAKELQVSSMRGVLTENSPDIRQARQELAALRSQLNKFEKPQSTGKNAEYIGRFRDYKYNEVLFEQLSRQYELAKLDESSDGAVIQVVDVAVPPERNTNMNKALVALLAAVVTGFMLVIFVFVRSALRNASANPEGAAKMVAIRSGFGRVLKPWRRLANTR